MPGVGMGVGSPKRCPNNGSSSTTITASGIFTPAVSGNYRIEATGNGGNGGGNGGGGGGYTAGTFALGAILYTVSFDPLNGCYFGDAPDYFLLIGSNNGGNGTMSTEGVGGTAGDNYGPEGYPIDPVGFTGGNPYQGTGGAAATAAGDGAAGGTVGNPGDGGSDNELGFTGFIKITGPLP